MYNRPNLDTFYTRKLNSVSYICHYLDTLYASKLKFGMLLKPLTLCYVASGSCPGMGLRVKNYNRSN